MKEIILTDEGSHTVKSQKFDATYHSTHGAIQETQTVFIDAGFKYLLEKKPAEINILEIGFGTGLNVFMTYLEAIKSMVGLNVNIQSIELYPLEAETVKALNYPELLVAKEHGEAFFAMHNAHDKELKLPLGEKSHFILKLILSDFEGLEYRCGYNLIYFDAFAPSVQPQLWQEAFLKKMYDALLPGGVLVTYCAQGAFKRLLKSLGFKVEALPGPKGKREMTRAVKC